ncbi:MAG: rod shape-determining protein MreD [Nitrospirae bacterium]|nr:rod shape-determining protein MreD [Nitrospirota bacterium]
MSYLLWAVAIFAAFFFQERVTLLGVIPNLTLLPVYYAGIRYGESRGLLAGVLTGYLQDSMSHTLLGPNILSKAMTGFFSALFVSGRYFRWTVLLGICAVSAMTFAESMLVFFLRTIFDKMPMQFSEALFISVMQALINGAGGVLLRPENAD